LSTLLCKIIFSRYTVLYFSGKGQAIIALSVVASGTLPRDPRQPTTISTVVRAVPMVQTQKLMAKYTTRKKVTRRQPQR
jgi:hypothetical protein